MANLGLAETLVKDYGERPEVAKLVATVSQIKCGLISGQGSMSPYEAHLNLKKALREYLDSTKKLEPLKPLPSDPELSKLLTNDDDD